MEVEAKGANPWHLPRVASARTEGERTAEYRNRIIYIASNICIHSSFPCDHEFARNLKQTERS
jgi:hypothetical protein